MPFPSLVEVQSLLKYLGSTACFSLQTIKRGMHHYLASIRQSAAGYADELPKPDGCNVEEMFDPSLFVPGRVALHPSSYPLRPDRLSFYHCRCCPRCRPHGAVQPSCYFATMLRCITHGWDPPINEATIVAKYAVRGNYPATRLFADSVRSELDDMLQQQVLLPVLTDPSRWSQPPHISPLGCVLKNSDIMRAKVLVGVHIRDQKSLTKASSALVASGHPKIKCRVTTDATATGLNAAAYSPPFRYPHISNAIALVEPQGYCGKCDVGRYFHAFPFALAARRRFCVEFGGILYTFARVFFGLASAPYYCSTWSAEFRRWFTHLGLPTAHMMDDWFIAALTEALAKQDIATITAIMEDCGFTMSADKQEFGRQLPFLGILIDTNTMTLRFEATQSRGTRLQLIAYLHDIVKGKHLDHSTIRHVCGKLNWYSEVVQSGRIHIKSWWDYERHGKDIYESTLYLLIRDTQWWIDLLATWEHGDSSLREYRISMTKTLSTLPASGTSRCIYPPTLPRTILSCWHCWISFDSTVKLDRPSWSGSPIMSRPHGRSIRAAVVKKQLYLS